MGSSSDKTNRRVVRSSALIGGWIRPLLLVLAGVLAYSNSFSGVMLFDDVDHILHNRAVRRLWPPTESMRSLASRPLVPLSVAVNYSLSGYEVWGYHFFNLAVHLGAACTLYALVRKTLRLPRLATEYGAQSDDLAFAAALLWVVHPLGTQAVTYIIQRGESMMALFFLLTVFCYSQAATLDRKRRWFVLAGLAYCLGLGCKEVMVMVLPVLWFYDRCFLSDTWADVLRQRGWFLAAMFLPLAAAATVFVPAMFGAQGRTVGFGEGVIVSPWEYACSQPGVILHYLGLALWPGQLCFDYGWPVETRAFMGILVPGLVIASLLVGSAWALFSGWRAGFLGVSFFLILAPTSSILPIQDLCAEHRMYLPLTVLTTLAVLAADKAWRWAARFDSLGNKLRRLPAAALLAAAATFGAMTYHRNIVYQDSLAMWQDVVSQRPENARAHNNLGNALTAAGRTEEAIAQYQQALDLMPEYALAYNNLGSALAGRGQTEAAIAAYEKALELYPNYAQAHCNLGEALVSRGQIDEAVAHYHRALEILPDYALAQNNLGVVAVSRGQIPEGIDLYRRALASEPSHAETHNNLGIALVRQGSFPAAIEQFQEALAIKPQFAQCQYNLGNALSSSGELDAAIEHYRRALEIDPKFVSARFNLGNLLARSGRSGEAIACYRQTLELDAVRGDKVLSAAIQDRIDRVRKLARVAP